MDPNCFNPVLITYTKLLRHRLAHLGHIDMNIMYPNEAEKAEYFNVHLGKLVGWFYECGDQTGILLLAREQIGGQITHAFLFLANTNHREFPVQDMIWLRSRLKEEPKFILVNVKSDTAQFLDHAILIECLYFALSKNMCELRFTTEIRVRGAGSLPAIDDFKDTAKCQHISTYDSREILDMMRDNGLKLIDLDHSGTLPRSFNILRAKIEGHYVYCINYRQEEASLILVPTIEQFPSPIHFEALRDQIDIKFPGMFLKHYWVRLRTAADCTSAAALQACILLTRIPLLYIDAPDLGIALEDLDKLSIGGSQNASSQGSVSASQARKTALEKPNQERDLEIVINTSARKRRPNLLSVGNQIMTLEFTLRSQQVIRREIGAYRAWMAVADDLTPTYPSTLEVKARSVPNESVLNDLKWLQEQLAAVALCWEHFTTVKLLECKTIAQLGRRHIEDKVERFIILPVRQDDDDKTCGLMIFDKERKEWGWLHPDNNAKDSSDLLLAVKERLLQSGPRYADWNGKIIIISSSYHKDFAYVHLVMALYYTGKLFKYAVQLPAKVVYPEQSFRLYSYHYCLALQVANQEYNLEHGFVNGAGELSDGAYVSLPSPVQFERAVVPSDICGFCKKRGYNNLGRHMSSAHGGQASNANRLRQIKYGYSSPDTQ